MEPPHSKNNSRADVEVRNRFAAYNEWFERKVKDSIAGVARGETVSDEEVRAWIEQRERS